MKRYFIILLCALLPLCSCSKEEQPIDEPEQLPVNFYNTSGTWSLTGLPEGTSVELTLKSSDKTFTLVQNTSSMYPVTYTGTYNLLEDETGVMILRGMYDYTWEYWNHEYAVTSLTEETMTLQAVDNGEVSEYVRK